MVVKALSKNTFYFSSVSLIVLLLGAISACTKQDATPIVIPPGQNIQYTNSAFVADSLEFYSIQFNSINPVSNQAFQIEDLTPKQDKDRVGTFNYLVPKDKATLVAGSNSGGDFFLISVDLTRLGFTLKALVLPGEVVTPSIESTLVYDLLANYPDKKLNSFSLEQVKSVSVKVQEYVSIKRQKSSFLKGIAISDVYRFLKNGLSSDKDFLDFLNDSVGMSFDYNAQGLVTSAPFPFGKKNSLPVLDAANSTPQSSLVFGAEMMELIIKGKALDPDGDLIFFQWFKEGTYVIDTPSKFHWIPDFTEGRPDQYSIHLAVTDGGPAAEFDWKVLVADKDRPPAVNWTCDKAVVEGQTWKCHISAVDFDGDSMSFSLNDKFNHARGTMNGQTTDDTTRLLKLSNISEADFVFVPDNGDAKNRTAYFEVTVDDGKLGGTTLVPITLTVEDINAPPKLLSGPIAIPDANTQAHEWDFCANLDPDSGGVTPYQFKIEVEDPDNQSVVSPQNYSPDQVAVNFGGSLKDVITPFGVADGCPPSTDQKSVFCFSWKAEQNRKTGTLTVQMKDDHGGMADLQTFNLVAEDRNQKPCLLSNGLSSVLSELSLQRQLGLSGQDLDGDTPHLDILNVPPVLAPFLFSCGSVVPISLFQNSIDSGLMYRTQNGSAGMSSLCVEAHYWSSGSGSVQLERSTAHTSDINIPAGYIFETNMLVTGKRMKFQTLTAVLVPKDALKVLIPVSAIDRTVGVGKLNRFMAAPPEAGMTVTNSLELVKGGNVTFTRPTTASNLIIPVGTLLGTSETIDGTSSIRYQTIFPISMPIGTGSVSAQVARVTQYANPNEVSVFSGGALPGPAWTVKNPVQLTEQTQYSLSKYKGKGVTSGVDRFCWDSQAEDGSTVAMDGIRIIKSSPEPTLSVKNSLPLGLSGFVQFSRTNLSGPLTIPSGTQVQAADLTTFETVGAVTLASGVSSATAVVRRVNHTSPTPPVGQPQVQTACVGFADTNYPPMFISSSSASVNQGSAIVGFPIVVTDNAGDPTSPHNPDDRYTFSVSLTGTAPEGAYSLCREPASSTADITTPACTPCTNTTLSYFDSATCYLRFKPTINDVSAAFTFQLTVDDNGGNIPSGTNVRSQYFTVNVIEQNDPPVFTDSTWNPLVGNAQANPLFLGDFVEGVTSTYRVYVTDSDKGLNLKQNRFAIGTQAFDLHTNTWVPAPTGMTIGVVSFTQNANGWGSKSIGQISWIPNDKDAKLLSSPEGFVVPITAYDGISDPVPRLTTIGYFKFHVKNINNTPSLVSFSTGNVLNILANTYFNFTNLTLEDKDFYSMSAPSFATSLGLCKSSAIVNCQVPTDNWPDELKVYDAPYDGNITVASCRQSISPYDVKTSVALPYLTRTSGPSVITGSKVQYKYRMEWCPQRRHIGKYSALLYLDDNGDMDRLSQSQPAATTTAPITFNVIAPVFFVSPQMSTGYIPAFSMKQTNAGLSSYPFIYKTIVNNSRSNALEYTILQAPRLCGDPTGNGVCINSATGVITWNPRRPDDVTDPSDPATWKKIEIQVRDKVTNEKDKAYFMLQVNDPLSPVSQAPSVTGMSPASSVVSVKERTHMIFSVTATDPNPADVLFYRWYVDGKLVYDASDSYDYLPSYDAGYKPSKHTITVEVTDGTYQVSKTWTVNVINNIPAPTAVFTLTSAVSGLSNLKWAYEVPAKTTVGSNSVNYLIMSGSYTRASVVRNFVWSLQFTNGNLNVPNYSPMVRPPWNYFESLPWDPGKSTERIAVKSTSASAFTILLSPQINRSGPYSNTTQGVQLSGDLSALSSLSSSAACTGSCAQSFYSGTSIYGLRPATSWSYGGNNVFSVQDDGSSLTWDRDGSNSVVFYTLPGNLKVGDVAFNGAKQRLYVSARDVGLQSYRLYIFDLNPVVSNLPPSYITDLQVHDGINPDNRLLDLIVVESLNSVYGLLPGTGGLVKLIDDASHTPTSAELQYIGVSEISSSYTDAVGSGRKLAYNPTNGMIYGLSKDSNQIFTVDTVTNQVAVFAADLGFDSISVFSNDGLVLVLNRSQGKVYLVR